MRWGPKMRKKLNEFIISIKDFYSAPGSDKVAFFIYFHTEVLKNPEINTKELKSLYDLADLPTPQNFGGEIKRLRRTNNLIKTKTGYKLSRSAKESIVSQLKASNKSFSKRTASKITLSFESLHPLVKKVSRSLFEDGHYSQAIFEAYKAVVNEVKNVSGVRNIDGKQLMERVFSVNNPIVKFNNLQTQSEQDEQVGLMFLFSGAALGIRNPKAHDNIIQKDNLRALEYLSFASLLLKRLDERVKRKTN